MAIGSLEGAIQEQKGDYFFKDVFDGENGESGMLSSASSILNALAGENGILDSINKYAVQLAGYMQYELDQYGANNEAIDKNTQALNYLTSAILMQTDMLDGELNGNITHGDFQWNADLGIYDIKSNE